jgi:hypothetical protein
VHVGEEEVKKKRTGMTLLKNDMLSLGAPPGSLSSISNPNLRFQPVRRGRKTGEVPAPPTNR